MEKINENITFEELLNQTLKEIKVGQTVTGTVIEITPKNEVFIDIGYKADGIIPANEYILNAGETVQEKFKLGDRVTAVVVKLNDGLGNVLLSYNRARREIDQKEFESKVNNNTVFKAIVSEVNEKGLITNFNTIKIFIPLSLSGINRNEDPHTYKGKEVSVMGSGMGMPSIGIYSYELYSQYDVENIIRIGSAGAYTTDLNLYDVVLAKNAYSESSFAKVQSGYESNITYPDDQLNEKITKAAKKLNIPLTYAPIHSADVFYREGNRDYIPVLLKEYGTVACEMESFALFHNAKVLNKKAACLVTISDSMVTYAQTSAEERQNALTNMIQIALEAAIDE